MFLGVLSLQWSLLTDEFWERVEEGKWHRLDLSLDRLVLGDFGAASVLITFGVLLGKVSPLQMLVVALIECVIYSLNVVLGYMVYKVADIGGSMVIHAFGAYFGLAASFAIGKFTPDRYQRHLFTASGHPLLTSRYSTDIMAMIGTVFLWLYWPSFNGAPGSEAVRERVVVNTVLSLCGSCIATFAVSGLLHHKLDMVDIQNATLAGGVGVGALADLDIHPASAMAVGMIVGTVSTIGYKFISPRLCKLGLHDTCGVHNLHAMPGVISSVIAIIVAAATTDDTYGANVGLVYPARPERSAGRQAVMQFACLATSIGIALVSGFATGALIKKFGKQLDEPEEKLQFSDRAFWEVPSDFNDNFTGSTGAGIELVATSPAKAQLTGDSDGSDAASPTKRTPRNAGNEAAMDGVDDEATEVVQPEAVEVV